MSNHRSSLTAAIVVGGLTLTACSSDSGTAGTAGSAGEPVEITFSSYNYGTPGLAGAGTQALLDAFAEAHPDITVVPQSVATADILTKTRADTAGGNAPDVVQMGYSKLNEAERTLPLQSLEEIAGDRWEDHTAGINQGLVEAGLWDGEVRALPFTVSVPALFYNADVFTAAGLDPEAPPTTADEVRDAAQAIVDAGYEGVYFGVVDPGKSDYLTQSVINSAGGAIVDDGEIAIDSPEAVEGLTALQDFTRDGLQPAVAMDDALASFGAGEMGMIVASTAISSSLVSAAQGSFDLRSAAFPTFSDGPAAPTHSGAGLVVLSEDEARQVAAWQFVEFVTSAEGYSIIAEQMGYLPLRADIVDDPAHLADHFQKDTLLLPSLEALDSVQPYAVFPVEQSNQATVIFQDDAVEPIVLRGADPAATLAEVADRIRGLED